MSVGRRLWGVLALSMSVILGFAMPLGQASVPSAFAEELPGEPGGPGAEPSGGTDGSPAAPEQPVDEPPVTPEDPVPGPSTETPVAPVVPQEDGLSALSGTFSTTTAPDNSAPFGSGPDPRITSSMSPGDYTIPSGSQRIYTVVYENPETAPITNARIWHQIMVGADHQTTFTVTCSSTIGGAAGGECPGWVPAGEQSIPDGAGDEYSFTFAGISAIQGLQALTFTIAMTSSFQSDVCTETGSAMAGGWARFSTTGFEVVDIEHSASSVGALSGAQVCPEGAIRMTNTVTSPRPPGEAPSRVLSGDPRVFTVTWDNTAGVAYSGVPLSYTYYVPYTRQYTEASWTCVSTIGGVAAGTCPAFMTGSASITHNDPGELADTVFSGTAAFAPQQRFTLTVTLATTITTCTQDGYLRVQSYAKRGPIDSENSGRTKSSELVEIGCSTWMLEEPFAGASVSDTAWKGLNSACLTRATSSASNGLGQCVNRTNSPRTSFTDASGAPKGFLQFTDDRTDQVGAVLYNRALPSADGVVVEFTQYQYGNDSSGADGIGFFLSDGVYELTAPGGMGGALGYAYRTATSWPTEQGLSHGYLGLGLDVFGNYVSGDHVATGCNQSSTAKPQSVALRGSGNGRTGYCLLAQNQISQSPLSKRLDQVSAGIPASQTASDYDSKVRAAIEASQRKVRVTVYPTANPTDKPRVTVEIDFNDGYFYRTVLDTTMDQPAPALIKFGFLGATGGSKQVHLIGNVRVGTVLPMKELNLVKAVDYAASGNPSQQPFSLGDTIRYQFVVHNASQEATGFTQIYNIQVADPLVGDLVCPKTVLERLESMVCTGSLVVTEADRDAGRLRNIATAAGSISSSEGAPRNLTARSAVDVPINPTAEGALRVIQPGGAATFQVLKHGTALGLVKPDDPSKITVRLVDPATSLPTTATSITVPGQGTWTINANNTVTFTPINSSYTGTVTPLKYQATNAYGGTATATLSVTIRVLPYAICTPAEQRASQRYWALGTQALLDFGTTGTAAPTAGSIANVNGGIGTFVVTDSVGVLQFVVDAGAGGRLVNRNGAVMLTGLSTPNSGTAPQGAQQVTAFPAGQGTGKYFVVSTSASSTAAGQLRYWLVDMSLNGGLGGVVSPTAGTALGSTGVTSTAITSVPNADGTGYWVLSPNKRGNGIRAYRFDATGPVGDMQETFIGTEAVPGTGTIPRSYEDIRFRSDLGMVATIASNGSTSRLRLLEFNAAAGSFTRGVSGTYERSWTTNTALGYSVEFSPTGDRLYTSSIATSGTNSQVHRRAIDATSLGNTSTQIGAAQTNGGAVRLQPGGGGLYWAANGQQSIRFQSNPSSATSSTTWSTQSLASTRTSGYGLPATLSDCAIPPAGFKLEKLGSGGALIDGAQFALYPNVNGAAGGTALNPGVQPAPGTGKFEATGLAPGTYWLRETKAPAGYSLLPRDVLIEIELRGVVKLDGAPNPQVQLVNASGVYTLRVTDTKTAALPFAGGQWLGIVTTGGAILLIVALVGGWWWRRRRQHDIANPADPETS